MILMLDCLIAERNPELRAASRGIPLESSFPLMGYFAAISLRALIRRHMELHREVGKWKAVANRKVRIIYLFFARFRISDCP